MFKLLCAAFSPPFIWTSLSVVCVFSSVVHPRVYVSMLCFPVVHVSATIFTCQHVDNFMFQESTWEHPTQSVVLRIRWANLLYIEAFLVRVKGSICYNMRGKSLSRTEYGTYELV